jgi:hypothetical protein
VREKPVIILFMPAFDRLRGWPAPFDNSDIPGGRDEKTAGTQSKERTAAGHGEGAQERGVRSMRTRAIVLAALLRAVGLWGVVYNLYRFKSCSTTTAAAPKTTACGRAITPNRALATIPR